MTIEVATYIADLQAANPGASDLRSQGDDHLRLLKAVLQASFPTASKAWYNPTTATKSADFTVVASDMNKTFLVDTSGGVVSMTLPTLASGDAGWECFHIKTTLGVNPVLVKPASGTLSSGNTGGLSATRRAIPNVRIRSFWTGTAWIIERAVRAPLMSLLDLGNGTLPYGYEWPNGQTLASASTNYPEYNALNGTGGTIDMRARVGLTLDNLGGSAAGRLGNGFISGSTLGATGGVDAIVLLTANLPAYTPSGTNASIAVNSTAANVLTGTVFSATTNFSTGGGSFFGAVTTGTLGGGTLSSTGTAPSFTGTAQGGTASPFSNLQPSIMLAKILVVE